MRNLALFVAMLLPLGGCQKEPAFEERYDKTAKEIEARAKAMDADISATDKAASDAGEDRGKRDAAH